MMSRYESPQFPGKPTVESAVAARYRVRVLKIKRIEWSWLIPRQMMVKLQ
jgi:hypothetical protein